PSSLFVKFRGVSLAGAPRQVRVHSDVARATGDEGSRAARFAGRSLASA
ncbi:MAG: hypothetical protein QOI74_760, partial [Micromonosporaceae bacterium]|nr:hypothetical protein [Micromonosporaceae bacterium]